MYFGAKQKNSVTLPQSARMKHAFLGEIKVISKTMKFTPRNKIAFELLHQILGHRSTISLLDRDTANIWEDVELIIDQDPFFQIMSNLFNKKRTRSKIQ